MNWEGLEPEAITCEHTMYAYMFIQCGLQISPYFTLLRRIDAPFTEVSTPGTIGIGSFVLSTPMVWMIMSGRLGTCLNVAKKW